MTIYLQILPRELQALLEHYINYEYWKCLVDYCNSISLISQFTDTIQEKQILEARLHIFRSKLTNCQSEIRSNETNYPHGLVFFTSLHITIQVDELITRDVLFEIFETFHKYFPYSHGTVGIINNCLKDNKIDERFITVKYGNGHYENMIAKISDCYFFK